MCIDNILYDKNTTIFGQRYSKHYFAFHLNVFYDLLECTFDDLIIQGHAKMDENNVFFQFVDRYNGLKDIFIDDKNHESYNGFKHIVKSGIYYLICVKDITSCVCITQSLEPYPEDKFDINVFRILTLKQTEMIKAWPQVYRFLSDKSCFDLMLKENLWYELNYRVMRFEIADDIYEIIITNFDRIEFSIDDIKVLYDKRWGTETSFREINCVLGLNILHSKTRKMIQQEIYTLTAL